MGLFAASTRAALQQTMTAGAGVLRTADSLKSTDVALAELRAEAAAEPRARGVGGDQPARGGGSAGGRRAAPARRPAGSHWREDFPERDDERWLGHLDVTLDAAAELVLTYERKT